MTTLVERPRGGRLLSGVLFSLLVIGIYADPLFVRRNFAGRDLLPYHLPVEKAIHDAYSAGRLPVWAPDVSGGRPLLANPNSGALYPPRAALALVSFPVAARIFPIAHWIAAGVGTMLLVRSLGGTAAAAWIGAVSYVFSGVGVSEVFFTDYQPGMTLLPWVVWATARSSRSGGAIVLALLLALDLLAGDVFTVGLALAASVLWLALETEGAERAAGIRRLAAGIGLAALLALPQIAATALWIPHTRRAVVGMKLDEALAFSLSPWRLLELAVPYPFGATWSLDPGEIWGRLSFRNYFATLYGGALTAIGAWILLRDSRRGARFARAVLLLSVLLAVGPSFVPASWGNRAALLPLRYPEKFSVGIVFALAVGAALAFDRFRGMSRVPRPVLAAGVLLAAAAALAALFPAAAGRAAVAAVRSPSPAAAAASRQLAPALAEAGLLWAATALALDRVRALGARESVGALLLLTLVPIVANRRVAPTFAEEAILSPTPLARILQRRDPRGAFRTLDESRYRPDSTLSAEPVPGDPGDVAYYRRLWSFYTPSLWNRGTVFNTDPDVGDLSRMQSLRDVSSLLASSAAGGRLFATLGLRFGVRFRDQEPLPGYGPAGGDGRSSWDENPRAAPSIRLLEKWREEGGALAAFRDLPALGDGEVAIETGGTRAGEARGGRVALLEEGPEGFRARTSSAGPGWLFVLRGFWPYRSVRVDGVETEVSPAHLAFSAVPVPAGTHRVDWKEEIPGGPVFWLGPAAFAGIAAAARTRDILRNAGRAA